MKVKYIGQSFGVDGLTDGKTYEVIEVDDLTGAFRLVDDSGEDYLYHPTSPKPNGAKDPFGHFEIVEDNEKQDLKKALTGVV